MGQTDVDVNDDFASEYVGVDREGGLYVTLENGHEVRFSLAVQQQIHDGLGDYFEAIS
jgi:hypothetical protein